MNKQFAIDELRKMVTFYSHLNETFNTSFSLDDLIKLYRFCTQSEKAYSEWNECPDTWSEDQINEALLWDGVTGKRK